MHNSPFKKSSITNNSNMEEGLEIAVMSISSADTVNDSRQLTWALRTLEERKSNSYRYERERERERVMLRDPREPLNAYFEMDT